MAFVWPLFLKRLTPQKHDILYTRSTHTCGHACVYVHRMYVHMYVYKCVHTHVCVCVLVYARVNMILCTHVCDYLEMCVPD